MKKFLLNYRAIAVMLLILASAAVNAQKTAIADGPWNSNATWGGTPPTAGQTVTINNGVDVTVPADASCASITFVGATGSLSVATNITLTVGGAVTVANAATGNRTATLSGAGSITCGSLVIGGTLLAPNLTGDGTTTLTSTITSLSMTGNLSMTGVDDGTADNSAVLNLQSGTISVGGTVVMNRGNGTNVTLTLASGAETGTLSIAGATPFTMTGTPTFTPDGGNGSETTINYSGAAQTVFGTAYRNLILSGSGSKTMTGVTVNGKLSMQGTATAGTTVTYSTAILEYKGSAAQTTSNNEFPSNNNDIDEVIIDNAAGVEMNAAKTLSGNLTLRNGYLTTSNTNLLTLTTAANATTENGAFVNGPLAKTRNSTTAFTFPVGSLSGGLRTIGIIPSSNNPTTFRATFNSASPKTSVTNGANLGGLAQISGCEYWDLARTDAGTANARVILSWPAAANSCGNGAYVSNIASLVVAHHNGTSWTNEGQNGFTGTATGGGTITSLNTLTSFSPFVLATTNSGQNPLPVMFADVKAFQKNSGVQIEWSNLTERDLIKYVVERSSNGQNFSTVISEQLPRGNDNDKESYTAFDASPLTGANFYRVKVYEIGGKIIYSKVLKVETGSKQGSFTLYPNPADGGQISVSMNAKQGQYTVKVINAAGQEVYAQRLTHQGGSMTQTVELRSVKPGIYNMVITGADYRETKTFIVQ